MRARLYFYTASLLMNPFDFFVQKVCLTTGGVEWNRAQAEFRRVGCAVERFDAVPAIGPHQSFNLGVKGILQRFYDAGHHSLLFLEDDVQFQNLDHLWPALTELPSDWDVFYLGCNIRSEAVKVTDRIYKITDAWTTHAVAYTRPFVEYLLQHFPDESSVMYDNWMGSLLNERNAYVAKPMCAVQRPRWSNIWNVQADYSQVFKESEEKCV